MEDSYPALRHFAHRGLVTLCRRALPAMEASRLPEFDYLAEAPVRSAALERWWAWWRGFDKHRVSHPGADVPLDRDLMPRRGEVEALVGRQERNIIAIGE